MLRGEPGSTGILTRVSRSMDPQDKELIWQ